MVTQKFPAGEKSVELSMSDLRRPGNPGVGAPAHYLVGVHHYRADGKVTPAPGGLCLLERLAHETVVVKRLDINHPPPP